MKFKSTVFLLCACASVSAFANERLFTYSYEPETMPKGGWEYEQWVALRNQRNNNVGQQNYNAWQIREALEYGVTDNYTVELYLNQKAESFRDPVTSVSSSKFKFDGVSFENRYMVWNPAEHAFGLSLYLEPRYSGDEAELEQKIIIGQRHGNWKWAVNLTHATEWTDDFHSMEGELELSAGLACRLNKHWSVGLELRDHNELPEYRQWENSAVFAGPVVGFKTEKWWAALTVMPQVYGYNAAGNPDGNRRLDLEGHERLNVRLIFGFEF